MRAKDCRSTGRTPYTGVAQKQYERPAACAYARNPCSLVPRGESDTGRLFLTLEARSPTALGTSQSRVRSLAEGIYRIRLY